MNHVAQPSRLRVPAASRRQHEHRAGRPVNSQARTPALHSPGSSWSLCMAERPRGLFMNITASRGAEFIPQAAFRRTEVRAPVVVAAGLMFPMHSKKRKGAFHESQGTAGILPAEESEKRSADETSAALCWRCHSTRSRFIHRTKGPKILSCSGNFANCILFHSPNTKLFFL